MINEKIFIKLNESNDLIVDYAKPSYDVFKTIIKAYDKISINDIDWRDLALILSIPVNSKYNTYKNKLKRLNESNLLADDKEIIKVLINKMELLESDSNLDRIPGILNSFYAETESYEQNVINKIFKLFLEIIDLDDDEDILNKTEQTIKSKLPGFGSKTLSSILHLLKPQLFPLIPGCNYEMLNLSKLGFDNINKNHLDNINNYVDLTRKLLKFRNDNFEFKNMLVFNEVFQNIDSEKSPPINSKLIETNDFEQNLILYGPPGTGKTYRTIPLAVRIIEKSKEHRTYKDCIDEFNRYLHDGRIALVTFHQSMGYEDFIEGIKPCMKGEDSNGQISYRIEDGIFKEMCNKSKTDPENNYVFIIDEINRGNISRIFGELITLLESNKRLAGKEPIKVRLPYSKEDFGIPSNLYVLGTMNTADRSLTRLDAALRRRFAFNEVQPDAKYIEPDKINEIDLKLLFNTINERIESLFDRDHVLGHSYFMGLKDIKDLNRTFRDRVIPLLQEYFYDDYGRINAVLSKNNGNQSPFMEKYEPSVLKGYPSTERYRFKMDDLDVADFISLYE